jgi:acetoacetyl-CoA synthetase
MTQPLWQPANNKINASNMLGFTKQIENELGLVFKDYQQLHQWSVDHPEQFWQQIWQFSDIHSSQLANQVLSDADKFPGAKWFKGARLNYAENALRNRSDKTALISRLENGARRTLSYAELY